MERTARRATLGERHPPGQEPGAGLVEIRACAGLEPPHRSAGPGLGRRGRGAEETLAALRDGRGETVRSTAPADDLLSARVREELAVSLRALRACTQTYENRRWSPGKLEPVADALWRAGDGYLDVLDAVNRA